MKFVETPLVISGLVWWYPSRYASNQECFMLLGDYGFFCPVEFRGENND